jgi:hypothetical protein
MFKELNQKYDALPPTRRFLTFMAIASPGFVLFGLEDYYSIPAFGVAGLLYFVVLAVPRIWPR